MSVVEKGLWMELEEYETRVRRSALLVKDDDINQYVQEAACRVAGEYCDDLRIYVIRNPGFNASMTANGVMEIWTGLLVRVSSEDELAAVLGHELAHYTQLHTLERFRRISQSMSAGTLLDLGIEILTGVPIPIGQLSAIANLMSFSREQESEADLMGVDFMARAGYDPGGAVRVWKTIVAEDSNAAVERRKPGVFSRTHPYSSHRIASLDTYITRKYVRKAPKSKIRSRHVEILNRHYMMLMEDQLDTNRFGRTEAILRNHQALGVDHNQVEYFRGEMYRQRAADGDLELARQAFERATGGEAPVSDAYMQLGYIHLKENDLGKAASDFKKYLEVKPDADDRAMIEFYLQEIGQ